MDAAQQLADKITNETEWTLEAATLRDAILRTFTDRLDAIATHAPDRLTKALAVIVQAGPGRTILVITDPATEDLVAELKRYADEPAAAASPIIRLLDAHLPI